MSHQCLPQRVDYPLVAQLREHEVEILHEQDQALSPLLREVQQGPERVGGQPLGVAFVLLESIRPVPPALFARRLRQVPKRGQPEIREVTDLVALFGERDGLPFR